MIRIKFLREQAGLKQKELGDKVGQSASNISKYELGLLEPNIDTLCSIANFFGVSIDFLVEKTDDMNVYYAPSDQLKRSYICLMNAEGFPEQIEIPSDKVDRFRALVSAGMPELFEK